MALFLPAENKDEKLANADLNSYIEKETTRENYTISNKTV